MIKKVLLIVLFLNIFSPLKADVKEKIILNLENTRNFTFNFEQSINDIKENGNCIIEYPKKLYCVYNNLLKKIIISNGKSIIIKNQKNNQLYIYSLKGTALDIILDKNYLINKIKNSKERIIDDKYVNYELKENNNKINIFFDKNTFNLIGWQTEDIYQNLSMTFISQVKLNQYIDQKKFKIPSNN